MSSSDDEEHRPLSETGPLSEGFEMKFSALRGEKGDQGERGAEGKAGPRLPKRQARAVVYLFIVAALVGIAALAGLLHLAGEVSQQQQAVAQQQQQVAREQRELDAQQKANKADRCTTVEEIAAIPVPHPVKGNPSREWESKYEGIEAARGKQLGCKPLTRGSTP